MEPIKQDMPPPGGFPSIEFERVPLKKPWPLPIKWLIPFAIMGVGWFTYCLDKKRIIYEKIEKRAATYSLLPLMVAENDRCRLRNYVRVRKEEAELMKGVEGWEVGTYYGEPIYKSLKKDEWYEPHPMEIWMYSDFKYLDYVRKLKQTH